MYEERERESAKNERASEREKELCNAYTIVNDEKKKKKHT
jgi:DnaJ-class molecular chaperone